MDVYLITGNELAMLLGSAGCRADIYSLRVAIDDGGVKFKLNGGTWSPAFGKLEK